MNASSSALEALLSAMSDVVLATAIAGGLGVVGNALRYLPRPSQPESPIRARRAPQYPPNAQRMRICL